jgi:hypothetical protein
MSGEEARAETKKVRKTVPKCRFGSRCRTEKCKFIHPDGEVTVAMKMSADKPADQMVVEQPAAVVISEPAPGQGSDNQVPLWSQMPEQSLQVCSPSSWAAGSSGGNDYSPSEKEKSTAKASSSAKVRHREDGSSYSAAAACSFSSW